MLRHAEHCTDFHQSDDVELQRRQGSLAVIPKKRKPV